MPHLSAEQARKNANMSAFDSMGHLRDFGDLTASRLHVSSHMKPAYVTEGENWNLGTICGMDGGVIHAGPENDGPRAVYFFAASITPGSSYDPEVQVHPWTLLEHVRTSSNYSPSMREEARMYAYTYKI